MDLFGKETRAEIKRLNEKLELQAVKLEVYDTLNMELRNILGLTLGQSVIKAVNDLYNENLALKLLQKKH